ncbi:MAG: DegV family protein [Caldilineaceae bacterium]|jgi:DegV family protein with EDD domain
MSKVRIVTDSNAYLSPEVRERYEIEVIPHKIKIGSAYFEEAGDFTADRMFEKLQEARSRDADLLPVVRAADLNSILDRFQRLGSQSEQIVAIHMSSELSPMWSEVRKAAEMLKGRNTIRVIDSLSTSYGLGLLVEQAAEVADAEADVHEIARVINGAVPHLYLALFSESLNYLERSAGLSPSQNLLGTMLGIKAMLMLEDGQLSPLEKVQTKDEVVEKLHQFVVEFASVERIGVLQHGYAPQQEALMELLGESLPDVRIAQLDYPPSLAAYCGPNIIGVMVYEGAY